MVETPFLAISPEGTREYLVTLAKGCQLTVVGSDGIQRIVLVSGPVEDRGKHSIAKDRLLRVFARDLEDRTLPVSATFAAEA